MNRKILFAGCMALGPFVGLAGAASPSHAARLTTLYKFTSDKRLEGVEGTMAVIDGVLYGATEEGGNGPELDGTIFKFDLHSGTQATLVNFTGTSGAAKGQAPTGPLAVVGSSIYGTTAVGGPINRVHSFGLGEVWKLNTRTGKERVFHGFHDTDGDQPLSGVTPAAGVFYGVTQFGGATNAGTVFELDASGKATDLYTFPDTTVGCNPTAGVVVVGKFLYGTTSSCAAGGGTVFSLNLATGAALPLHFFAANNQNINNPQALVVQKGALYGTTFDDGGSGTIYKIELANHQYTLLHTFGAAGDGAGPTSGLASLDGVFYGVTTSGGAHGAGTIYTFDPATGNEAVVYSFTGGSDGDSPDGGLLAYKGVLYGSTLNTDSDNQGTIFGLVP